MQWPWWLAFWRKRRVGIALSGGGARGFAHIGVLKVLLEGGIKPVAIAGTSAGALAGVFVAAQIPIEAVFETAMRTRWTQLVRPVRPGKLGLLTLDPMDNLINMILGGCGERCFEDLPIRFACVATDIERGEEVILDSGPITPAIRASCSVPGIFTPVEHNGKLLVDGGVTNNLPTKILFEMGIDYVIAIDLIPPRSAPHRPASIFDVTTTTFYNLVRANHREGALAQITIIPDIRQQSFVSFDSIELLIHKGEEAALHHLPKVTRELRMK